MITRNETTTRKGRGRSMYIYGRAGSGKSTIVKICRAVSLLWGTTTRLPADKQYALVSLDR